MRRKRPFHDGRVELRTYGVATSSSTSPEVLSTSSSFTYLPQGPAVVAKWRGCGIAGRGQQQRKVVGPMAQYEVGLLRLSRIWLIIVLLMILSSCPFFVDVLGDVFRTKSRHSDHT
jgi:hypothetical protein